VEKEEWLGCGGFSLVAGVEEGGAKRENRNRKKKKEKKKLTRSCNLTVSQSQKKTNHRQQTPSILCKFNQL